MNNKNSQTDFDILIVGGGMVGATLACALAGQKLRIGLLDSTSFNSDDIPYTQPALKFDSRVSAITPASKRLLEKLGVWEEIHSRRYSAFSKMHVWDADGTGSIHFAAQDINQPALGFIVENSVILASLHRRLGELPEVRLIAPANVSDLRRHATAEQSGITVVIDDGREFSASLLIAADGPLSGIRSLADFKTREWDYQQLAIVTTVRTEHAHGATALQRFMDTGPLAFLPLSDRAGENPDQHYCSIVWSLLPEKAEMLLALSDQDFAAALQAAIENKLGTVEWVDQRVAFPLRQRHATDYVQQSIALVGDAAHTIHPLAGQGVNLGLMDAQVLAEEIIGNLQRGREINELSMLRRYQRRRISQNLGMMWLMEGFKFLFEQQSLPVRWLRNTGLSGVDKLAVVKNRLMRQWI